MTDFSKRGEACTEFEQALVHSAEADAGVVSVWVGLARRVGLDAIAAVLDELGTEKVHVPTRENFFQALWRARRDAEIRRRLAAHESVAVVAADFHLSARAVYGIRNSEDVGSQRSVIKGRR